MANARKGTFLATPMEWAVNSSKNNLPQFVCRFSLDGEFDKEQGGYFDCSGEGMETIWYGNLIYKKDGQNVRNEINIKSIEQAFGWNDRNMETLNTADWSGIQVQLVLEDDTYNGKTAAKVKYVNHRDHVGGSGVEKADSKALQQMALAFGALLKAGATPTGKAVARPASNPAASIPDNPCETAKREAWDAFKAANADIASDKAALAAKWKDAIQACFKRPATQLGAAQWKDFAAMGFAPAAENPISEQQQFKEDDIPF